MYGQLYHRIISRELPEPQRDPRGRVRRGGGARVGAGGSMGGQDSVGSGPGLGWRGLGSGGAGERASVGAMRRRGQHEGSRKRPIGGSPRPQWAAWRMAGHGGRNAGGEARRVQDGGDERGRDGRERRPRRAQARWQGGACSKQARRILGNVATPWIEDRVFGGIRIRRNRLREAR